MSSALGTRTLVIRGDRGLCRVHGYQNHSSLEETVVCVECMGTKTLVIRGDRGLCRVHWEPEPLSQLCTRQLVMHAQRLSDGEF